MRVATYTHSVSDSLTLSHACASSQLETMLSPYFGSPLGALASPSHPQRGREADRAAVDDRGVVVVVLLGVALLCRCICRDSV